MPHFNILIESGHCNEGQVADIFKTLRNIPDEVMASHPDEWLPDLKILNYGFGDKKEYPTLQAADMVAYSQLQSVTSGDGTIWSALRNRVQPLRRDPKPYWIFNIKCDDELIRRYSDPAKLEGRKGEQ